MNVLRLKETMLINKDEFIEKTVLFFDRELIEWCIIYEGSPRSTRPDVQMTVVIAEKLLWSRVLTL